MEFAVCFHLHVDSKVRIQAQASGLLCSKQLCPLSRLTNLHPHVSESWLDHQLRVVISLPFLR